MCDKFHATIKKLADEPLFFFRRFLPAQPWLLKWMRPRMIGLNKNPLWYSLRSIRQGASTKACELKMPEIFLRASGGWKGDAMEVYRKDRLPAEQARFASKLSQKKVYKNKLSEDPTDLSRPFGSGGGILGNFNSPPPSTPRHPLLRQLVFSRRKGTTLSRERFDSVKCRSNRSSDVTFTLTLTIISSSPSICYTPTVSS